MKIFKIESKHTGGCVMKVTLYNPPYENKNVLHKTGIKEDDVIIKEIYTGEENNDND